MNESLIDWEKAADGNAVKLIQDNQGAIYFINKNHQWWNMDKERWELDGADRQDGDKVLATRPKPPLTEITGQQLVDEMYKWKAEKEKDYPPNIVFANNFILFLEDR